MSETEQLKARIKKLEDEKEHIFCLINKYFEPPCTYEYGDIDAYDLINSADKQDGITWCEANCGDDSYLGDVKCWKKFFEVMEKAEKEQLKYGRAQDDTSNNSISKD